MEFRIFGPPGTGKTSTLAGTDKQEGLIERAAKKFGSDNVLVASFTKAAAVELVGRNLPMERGNVGTLHSLAYRAIGRPEIAEKPPLVNEWNEAHPQWALGGGSHDIDDPYNDMNDSGDGDDPFQELNRLRALMVPKDQWPDSVKAFADRWGQWKRWHGAVDFTDMIDIAAHDCEIAPGCPSVGFFDEVQDFSKLEISLVRTWAENMEYVVMAGDDDQGIYSFKGASPDAFLNPPIPEEHKTVLRQSYRVPRAIHKLASTLIMDVSRREPKEYMPRDEDGCVYSLTDGNYKYPEPLMDDMERHLSAGKTVMILASCSYMLQPTLQVLRRLGIPYHNPYRRSRGDWNPLRAGGSGKVSSSERLLSYLRPVPEVWGDAARMWTIEDLRRWSDMIQADGTLARGAKGLIKASAMDTDYPLDLPDLLEWFEPDVLLDLMATNYPLEWLEHRLLAAKAKALEFPLTVARERGAKALCSQPQVKIGTIHSVKGGEADVVYLFPDISLKAAVNREESPEENDALIRTFYVAVTRARETLVICGPATYSAMELPESVG
ncbi:MAG: ATP-dependent helicase [bacterium]|nr:ATP-dependent helicase [bacterium]